MNKLIIGALFFFGLLMHYRGVMMERGEAAALYETSFPVLIGAILLLIVNFVESFIEDMDNQSKRK